MSDLLPDNAKLVPDNASKVFSGVIHDVYHWQQPMYDGTIATFEMLKRTSSVIMLGVLDDEQVIVLQQEQPDRPLHWTLPAGRIDDGEDPITAAKREMQEETGYEFTDWKLVHIEQFHNKFEWFGYFFVATNVASQSGQKLDGGEKITVHQMLYSELVQLIRDDKLKWNGPINNLLLNGKDQLSDILNLSEIN